MIPVTAPPMPDEPPAPPADAALPPAAAKAAQGSKALLAIVLGVLGAVLGALLLGAAVCLVKRGCCWRKGPQVMPDG